MHEKKVEYLTLLDLKDNSVNMTKSVHMLSPVKQIPHDTSDIFNFIKPDTFKINGGDK